MLREYAFVCHPDRNRAPVPAMVSNAVAMERRDL